MSKLWIRIRTATASGSVLKMEQTFKDLEERILGTLDLQQGCRLYDYNHNGYCLGSELIYSGPLTKLPEIMWSWKKFLNCDNLNDEFVLVSGMVAYITCNREENYGVGE